MKSNQALKYKFIIFGIFALFFFLPSISHAANRYWVGGSDGANTNDTANWASADPASCTGGGASVPGTSDIAIFDPDCDNGATVNASFSVLGININSGYTGTITQSATVTVGTSDFIQAGGTFTSGAYTLDVNDAFTISGGTFTAPSSSGTFTVAGSFTKSGSPTFNANSGTLTFDGTVSDTYSIDASGVTFNKIVINKSGAADGVATTLTIVSGTTIPLGNSPTVTISDVNGFTFTNNGTITTGTGTATFTTPGGTAAGATFTNAGTISTSATSFDFNIPFTNSGTATFSTGASPTMTFAGSLTVASTSTFPSGANVTFDGSPRWISSVDASGVTFNNVIINRSDSTGCDGEGYSFTITSGTTIPLGNSPTITFTSTGCNQVRNVNNNGTITVGTGTLTITMNGVSSFTNNGTIQTKTSTLSGKAITNATNSIVIFTGDGDAAADTQTITSFATTYYNLTINSTDGTTDIFQLGSSPTINNNLTVTTGVFDANGYNVSTTGSLSLVGKYSGDASGGTITYDGAYTVHTFTSSGTFTPPDSRNVEVLVVAGGGGGGAAYGGGGGAGGLLYNSSFAVTSQAYSVTVGAGGAGAPALNQANVGTNGSNSVFSTMTATGGGGGAGYLPNPAPGVAGGSGGGGAYNGTGGAGTGGQGNNGGTAAGAPNYGGGGGGGSSAVGANGTTTAGGNGGTGTAYSISGSSVTYAGGGGGGTYQGGTAGSGGAGGGGAGGSGSGNNPGTNGTANTGGGGGGSGYNSTTVKGGDGGSGIVIMRYLTSGTLSGATLRLKGGETFTTPTLSSGSTVQYTGTAGPYTLKNWTYHHLTINGAATTFNLPATTDVNGNLTITAGTLDATATPYNMTVAGNWSNSGTFTPRTGTVTLDGTSQTISGSTTFNNLSKTATATDTLTFTAGTTQTISGVMTLLGSWSKQLSLRSSSAGTQWSIDPQSTRTIAYLDVKDSNNTNVTAIDASSPNNLNSGNNTNWTFSGVAPVGSAIFFRPGAIFRGGIIFR